MSMATPSLCKSLRVRYQEHSHSLAMSTMTLSLLGALLLLAGRISAAATAADGVDIRLPSDGAAGNNDDKWPSPPWECCDNLKQSPLKIWPPRFRCLDEVDHCAAACEQCKEVSTSPAGDDDDTPRPRYVCLDWYSGFNPGSKCTDDVDAAAAAGKTMRIAGEAAASAERPWKCCDLTSCTRSWPPTCSCLDTVESCAAACQKCEQVVEESSAQPARYRCLDRYFGFPGPKCHT